MTKIQREEYCRDTFEVAKDIVLGSMLYTNIGGKLTGGIITELEVYLGGSDKASHSYNYRRTKRTEIQYGLGGYAYVFLVYGIHHQFCIVTNINGIPDALLIRALEPVDGIDIMKERRGQDNVSKLTVGPGNVCKATGITLKHYGTDLTGDEIFLCRDIEKQGRERKIVAAPRIGIDYAEDYKDVPWRFYIDNSKFVSKP